MLTIKSVVKQRGEWPNVRVWRGEDLCHKARALASALVVVVVVAVNG